MMSRTKSVWTPIDRKRDGLRILVTRFRGRGMPTSRYDVWMPSLGPSERLLRRSKPTATQYARAYKQELLMDGPIDARCTTIKNHGQKFTLRLVKRLARTQNVTLLCHCPEDADYCHRHALKALIESSRI